MTGPTVEFVPTTAVVPSGRYSATVTDAGSMLIFWNSSSGRPDRWATAALMGSAWLKQATTPPRCRAAMASSAATMRSCISGKLSPPGKRNVDGACWTVFHSGSRDSSVSCPPVHSPKSHSTMPPQSTGSSPELSAAGAAVSRARSIGEV